MADEQNTQTNPENVKRETENTVTGPYVVNGDRMTDTVIDVKPQPITNEDMIGIEKADLAEENTSVFQKDVLQIQENTDLVGETPVESQEELNDKMWQAVMDLNRLQSPVEPGVGEDGKMSEYHQGEMAGSEEEIEEARIRLFGALDKGADINAVKETGSEKETILNYVVDVGLADDLRAQGAKVVGSLEEHRADVNWFKKEITKAQTPEEKAYAEDMLAIHEDMVDYLREEKAYEVYDEMFDEQTGVFEFKGDEMHPIIQVKGNLSREQRNDLAEALTFFAEENGMDAQKMAGFRKLIDSENGKKILDVNLGAMLVGEYDKYVKVQEEAEKEDRIDETENNNTEESEVTVPSQEEVEEITGFIKVPKKKNTRTEEMTEVKPEEITTETEEVKENVSENADEVVNQTEIPFDTNVSEKPDTEETEEFEPAFTPRDGIDGETGCLGMPRNATVQTDEMTGNGVGSVAENNSVEEENTSPRTELHQLADKSNPDDFAWATERAKNVIAEHPEYLNAKSNDQYGVTAMMCAVNKGNVAMLNTLIEKGADINIQNEYGETALMYAAYHGDMLMMKKLIENGADITKVAGSNSNYAGQDFLGVLAANGHEDMLPAVMEMVKGQMQEAVTSARQENADLRGQQGSSQENIQTDIPQASNDDVSSAELAAELAMLSAQASKVKAEIDGTKKENSSLLDELKKRQVGAPKITETPEKKIDLRQVQARASR